MKGIAIRRHHRDRLFRKRLFQLLYINGWKTSLNESRYRKRYFNDMKHIKLLALKMVDTPCSCSCCSCGNPRKYLKGKEKITIQERKIEDLTRIMQLDMVYLEYQAKGGING